MGVTHLTLFGFSTENWRRPHDEVEELMALLRRYLSSHVAELHENDVRLRIIGDRRRFGPEMITLFERAEDLTRHNRRIALTLALNYGGRQEIVAAARGLACQIATGAMPPAAVDDAMFTRHLETSDLPDADLIIRTGGEKRISNFLLWQAAYAELVFVDTLWPDFAAGDLGNAIGEFGRRERRYGALVSGK